jgi:hypothetical protein
MADDYYVYVYIDPRNLEEFYYGKGKDRRKEAHLTDTSDSEKTQRIKEIRDEGLEPTIRVIARGLSESDAFLVEKTLLWKLGKTLANKATGSFSEKFRPHNKLHLELSGFDYLEGIYYFNIGEGDHRLWSDCKRLGFISAGQGTRWRDAICAFRTGDIIAAYLKKSGFVGIGRITQSAIPIRNVKIGNVPLIAHPLDCKGMSDNIDSDELCEHVALVHWYRAAEPSDAHWIAKSGIFTTQLVRASLEGQKETQLFLEERFGIQFDSIRQHRATNEGAAPRGNE